MILNRKDTSKKPAAKITIKPLSCSNDVPVFCSLMAKIFQIPPEYEQGLKEFTFDSIQAGWKFYLEYINKTPVGTGALFSANKVGGVFNVGTLSEYRKQGIGTALMQQIICDSIDSGNLIHTLQAETGKDAERLYKKMGFTIDHHIQFFAKENKS